MNRRAFLRAGCAGSLAALTARCLREGKRPNIIYILADDLGYGDLSCYGQKRFRTPYIDNLAEEGMRFTNHYSGSTVCAPARCCLMTGMHSGHARVRGNYETGPHGWGACLELRPEDLTVAECLKTAGYATGVFGKWSLGVAETTGAPWKKGFDRFFGYLNQGRAHFYYPEYLMRDDRREVLPGNRRDGRSHYSHDLIFDEALKFIDSNRASPFFLYWAVTIPHAELLVPETDLEPFRGRYSETPYTGDHYGSQETPRAAFAAMVSRLDRDIGRLVARLREWELDRDTVILFSSDNGPHREGGHDPDFFNSSGPFRGIKRDLYEGGIRVPLIVRWPGRIKPGAVSDHVSAFWDVMPTLCEIARTALPDGIDGISFLPVLFNRRQPEHQWLYWEFHENPTTNQAVRFGRWKGVRHSPAAPVELYDLYQDPGETVDLSAQHPEIAAKIERLMLESRTPHEIWPLKS